MPACHGSLACRKQQRLANYIIVDKPYCQRSNSLSCQLALYVSCVLCHENVFGYVQEATRAFHNLSPAQFNTGWVLCQLGRAYYEMVDYPAAANVFEFARQADRHRLEVCGHPP